MAETLGNLMGKPEKTSEASAAAHAYIPGYPDQEIETDPNDQQPRGTGEIWTETGQSDLSLTAKKKLVDYAREHLKSNMLKPDVSYNTSVGGKRIETLGNHGKVFTDGAHPTAKNKFEESDPFFAGKITDLTSPGKTPQNTEKSGHTFLRDIEPHPGENETSHFGENRSYDSLTNPVDQSAVTYATHQILQRENKFSPSEASPYISPDQDKGIGEAALTNGLYSLQGGNLGLYNKDATQVTVKELRQAALDLMLRAQSVSDSAAFSAAEASVSAGAGPFGIGFGGADLFGELQALPQMTQWGSGLASTHKLRIRSTRSAELFGGDKSHGQDDFLNLSTVSSTGERQEGHFLGWARNAGSQGTMTSWAEPFQSGGMFWPVAYIAFSALLMSFLMKLAFDGKEDDQEAKNYSPSEPWNLTFGQSPARGSMGPGSWFADVFGWSPLPDFNFFRCFFEGFSAFFGMDEVPDLLTFPYFFPWKMADAILGVVTGPGFYLTIMKQVMRSVADIGRAIDTGNVVGLFVGGLIALNQGAMARFMLIMVQIGAQGIRGRNSPGAIAHGGDIVPLQDQGNTGAVIPSAKTRGSVSRFDMGGTGMSPLSLSLFNSLYLPGDEGLKNIALAKTPLLGVRQKPDMTEKELEGVNVTDVSRWTADQAETIEKLIDQEYVPFSIQDMRTNELISLPAFVSAITDDFSTDYSQSAGFGRTDPVMTYNKTSRNISITFSLVAMNKSDHMLMWHTINKIVAMCYPQKNMGRIRESGDKEQRFIQPFSQMNAASPMIRIKLGDLLASNASGRAMEKIFGALEVVGHPEGHTAKGRAEYTEWQTRRAQLINRIKEWHFRNEHGVGSKMTKKMKRKEGVKYHLPKGTFFTIESYLGSEQCQSLYDTKIALTRIRSVKVKRKIGNYPDKSPKYAMVRKFSYVFELDPPMTTDDGADGERDHYMFGGKTLLEFFRDQKFVESGAGQLGEKEASKEAKKKPIKFIVGASSMEDSWIVEESELKEPPQGGRKGGFYGAPSGHKEMEALVTPKGVKLPEDVFEFMSPKNNMAVKAFRSNRGSGLAGFITSLSLGYDSAMWGITADGPDLRVPKKADLTLNFTPIHDFPLGLDYRGRLIAPSHPAGPWHASKQVAQAKEGPPSYAEIKTAREKECAIVPLTGLEAMRAAAAEKK